MRILTILQAAALSFLLAGSVCAQPLPAPVEQALDAAGISPHATGVFVQEVNSSIPLLAWNVAEPFSPASTMKLVTTDAALELLGPSFTWKTGAYATGPVNGGVLEGDLVIKGSGDPKLVIENLWLFLRRIRAAGISDIRGDLVLDRSAFEAARYDPAEFDGEPLKTYNTGPDALLLNYEALGLHFVPDPATHSVAVDLDPPLDGFALRRPVLGNGPCGDWRERLQPEIDGAGARFAGSYPLACGERTWYLHPYQMSDTRYFELLFRSLWHQLGGTLEGRVHSGLLPADARPVAEWESPPLAEVIRDINKFSNNVMARQVLLTIANQVLQIPGSAERGAAAVKAWLANHGIAAPELTMDNGSGLSRSARISAQSMGQLLVDAFRSPTMPELIASLPLAAYDGTMRHRLQQTPLAGRVHMKTGTLEGVRAIAGYLLAASGRRYAVVFFVNHPNAEQAPEAEDRLLEWVYANG